MDWSSTKPSDLGFGAAKLHNRRWQSRKSPRTKQEIEIKGEGLACLTSIPVGRMASIYIPHFNSGRSCVWSGAGGQDLGEKRRAVWDGVLAQTPQSLASDNLPSS